MFYNKYTLKIKPFRYLIISSGATRPDNPFSEKEILKHFLVELLGYDQWEIHWRETQNDKLHGLINDVM